MLQRVLMAQCCPAFVATAAAATEASSSRSRPPSLLVGALGTLWGPDPAGFTIVDTLACGAVGHVLGVGIVLGLRATGGL